jgi:hypothetical protein
LFDPRGLLCWALTPYPSPESPQTRLVHLASHPSLSSTQSSHPIISPNSIDLSPNSIDLSPNSIDLSPNSIESLLTQLKPPQLTGAFPQLDRWGDFWSDLLVQPCMCIQCGHALCGRMAHENRRARGINVISLKAGPCAHTEKNTTDLHGPTRGFWTHLL